MENRATFEGFEVHDNICVDLDPEMHLPTTLRTFDMRKAAVCLEKTATHFIYLSEGLCQVTRPDAPPAFLDPGMFAVVPGECAVEGGAGIIISRREYLGLFQLGGPIEEHGRLKYIDGCTDTLLAAPPRKGDPCLNLAHIPAGIEQTPHTHPSVRAGLVMSGRGQVVYLDADGEEQVADLIPGRVWVLHTDGLHHFRTPYGVPMRLLSYHPDSNFGPTDSVHPVLNSTLVDGVPASMPENLAIRTP